MNANIRQALAILLDEGLKVSSWGISSISIGEDFVSFNVDGLIYKGRVQIKGEDNGYCLMFDDGKAQTCPAEYLVQVLDENIEKTSTYRNDLQEWFSNSKETRRQED